MRKRLGALARRKAVAALSAATILAGLAAPAGANAAGWIPPGNWNPDVFDATVIKLLPKPTYYTGLKRPSNVVLSNFPLTKDLRQYAEPVEHQGGVNSCTAWAIVYGMGGWWANKLKRMKASDWFNPMSAYAPVTGYKNTGSALTKIFDYATVYLADSSIGVGNKGVGMTRAADYSVDQFDFTHKPTVAERLAAKPFRFSSYRQLYKVDPDKTSAVDQAMIRANIVGQLAAGRPVALGFRLIVGFTLLDKDSAPYYKPPADTDPKYDSRGNHVMLALGYDSQGLLVQNSWGTGWGDSGYKRLSWDYVKKNAYEAVVAMGLR